MRRIRTQLKVLVGWLASPSTPIVGASGISASANAPCAVVSMIGSERGERASRAECPQFACLSSVSDGLSLQRFSVELYLLLVIVQGVTGRDPTYRSSVQDVS